MDWTEVPLDGSLPSAVLALLDRQLPGAAADPGQWCDLGAALGDVTPRPGAGSTSTLWGVLATLAAADLQVARAVEPHLDALAILAEARAAGAPVTERPGASWGVYAAEAAGTRLGARRRDGGWLLSGTKPWCSLADRVSHALVTAWVDDERRALFAVDLRHAGVTTDRPSAWHARGLRDVVSLPVELSDVPAEPVGEPGWYLERDGFAWGGIGVAAVWYGGAVGLVRRLARTRARPRDQVSLLHLGEADRHLFACRAVLREAATDVDAGRATGESGALLALRVRAVVAAACEAVLVACEHDLGPGPQVGEPEHAARLADLRLYLRQHHAERDVARLGELVVAGSGW